MALTINDAKLIRQIVHDEVIEAEERINSKISHLPNKNEFFDRMDSIAGKLIATREEHTALSEQVSRHDKAISDLQLAAV